MFLNANDFFFNAAQVPRQFCGRISNGGSFGALFRKQRTFFSS